MSIVSGSVIPATAVVGCNVLGGAAIRVFNAEGIPRTVVGGPATPVVVLTDADIEDNGGPFRVAGGTAIPMVAVADRPIRGGAALRVYPVDANGDYDSSFASSDPYEDYLVYATFMGDDETLLTDYVPEKDAVGSGFQIGLSGTWKITGNKAYQSAGAGGVNTVYIDTGRSDFTVECVVNCGTAVAAGLVVRAKDGDDNLEVFIDLSNWVKVYKNVAGGRAGLRVVAVEIAPNTDYDIKVVLSGTSIKVYVDDVLKIDINDSTHQTETGVGFWTWNASTDARWDDLTVQV